ncbi:MAG: 2TM domain-containing protein [Sneathiellaceae bacterium]
MDDSKGVPADDEQLELRARKHVAALRGFYVHAAMYLAVNLGLLCINLLSSPDRLWFYWPLLGWGVGLAAHALRVFAVPGFDSDWEERKVAEYKNRERNRDHR